MRTLSFLFSIGMISIFTSGFGQKVKREVNTIKYFRAAKLPQPTTRYYNVDIEEKREELDGSISEKKLIISGSNDDVRNKFYLQHVNYIKDFHFTGFRQEPGSTDTISLLSLSIGQTQIISSVAESENIINEAKQITGVRWYMRVTINMPFASTFTNEKGEILINQSEKPENIKYSFPNQFSKTANTTFSTKETMQTAFNTNKAAFLLEIRDKFIATRIDNIKKTINQSFNDDEDFFAIDFYSVKGKKGEFDDLDGLIGEVQLLVDEMQLNYKAKNKMNWHSESMKTKFTELCARFSKLLSDDAEKTKSSIPTRFTYEGQEGILKNVLWCKFFIGEFDYVINEAYKKVAEQSQGPELLPDKVFFDNIIEIAKMYQPIYLNNKARLNWH